ncbi:MAG: PH domain-containing protein [Candidatus Nanoarchaeia archaeon]|nr:PH domain-containing protein [Candidatus Nanoarchaeia archaeon]MDD5740670.1 PH domain-containing protein [Candidatus Nanoarchaeia archaeon]
MKTQLHPGARWLFRLKGYSLFIFIIILLVVFSSPTLRVTKLVGGDASSNILMYVFGILFLAILFTIIIAEIYARMAYNRWFYEFTDSNLKLERGIIWKRYSNVPYERVQNVDIQRGILARILGFSSVMIQTAGYSYTARGRPSVEGYIPAVDIDAAEKIRDFLMKKISKNSKQGL